MKKILAVLTVLSLSFALVMFTNALEFSEALEKAKEIVPGQTVGVKIYDDKVWTDSLDPGPIDCMMELYYIIDLPSKGKFNIVVDGVYYTNVSISVYDSNGNILKFKGNQIYDSIPFAPPVKRAAFDDFNSATFNPGEYLLCIRVSDNVMYNIGYIKYGDPMEIVFGFECEHTAGAWKTVEEGNCREGGVRAKYCTNCGEELAREKTGLGDHDYGKWEVVREATEQADGLRVRECDICGKDEEDVLEQLVHGKYTTAKTIKATCTEDGAKNKVCKYCDEIIESEVIPAKGHKVSKWKISKEPTAIYAGIEEGKCSTCKQTVEREVPNDPTLPIDPNESIPFDDITKDKWYYDAVLLVYINHYMIGASPARFNPTGNMTVAEAITVAVRIFSANADKSTEKLDDYLEENPTKEGESWYQPYTEYAILVGILEEGDFADYSTVATRAEIAYIFARCVEMEQINEVEIIPDVDRKDKYGEEIYYLYNAGILAGNDKHGTFTPEREITRAEASALIARITKLADRIKK